MVAGYTPTEFVKGSDTEVATTWAEHWQLIWDGYTVVGDAPETPRSLVTARLSDIDAAIDELAADTEAELLGSIRSLVYDGVTGWPARPVSPRVIAWIDPTAEAPEPPDAQPGDLYFPTS